MNSVAACSASARNSSTPRALIERYLAAYNRGDVPGMLALLHPDVTFENVAGGQVTATAQGREEFRALAEHAATLFTTRHQAIREYVPTSTGAQVEIDYEGTLAVDLGPELRAGETLRLRGRSTPSSSWTPTSSSSSPSGRGSGRPWCVREEGRMSIERCACVRGP